MNKKECIHEGENLTIVDSIFKEVYQLLPTENIFYCQDCNCYCFIHTFGMGEWVFLEELPGQLQIMRSIDVFYERDLDINDHMTPEAKANKADLSSYIVEHYATTEFLEPDHNGVVLTEPTITRRRVNASITYCDYSSTTMTEPPPYRRSIWIPTLLEKIKLSIKGVWQWLWK